MIIEIDWSKEQLSNLRNFYKIMLGVYGAGPKLSDNMIETLIELTIAQLHLDAVMKKREGAA